MTKFPPGVLEWMRDHHSTMSSDVVDRSGMSVAQRKALVGAGSIERLLDGAYRFTGAEITEEMLCAAVSTARPKLVIAGPTAARLWGLRRAPRDRLVHVIGPPFSQPSIEPWIRAFRTDRIRPQDIVHRDDGIRLTSPSRTVIDHSRFLRDQELSSMIEAVLAASFATVGTLARDAKWLATPGRPWARHFLEVLGDRVPGGGAESDWETKVAGALAARGVTGLVRQHRVSLPGHGTARFDIAIPDILWAFEVDVHPAHETELGKASDKRRDRASQRIHWSVARIGESDLRTAFDREMDALVESIATRREEVAAMRSAGLAL